MGLVDQALRLSDPVLCVLLLELLVGESRAVESRLDLEGQRVALAGQILDRALDRAVDAFVAALDRPRRGREGVHCKLPERRVQLLVDGAKLERRLPVLIE